VWRNKDVQTVSSVGFARFVFFQKLLPKYHALIADQEQTKNGTEFWQYSVDFAFESGRKVYFLDRRSTPNSLTLLSSLDDVKKLFPVLWGKTEGHKRTFLMISDRSLVIEPKSERKPTTK
jgi:hypothetical protein